MKLLTNAKTVISNSNMLKSYQKWVFHKMIGSEPKINIPYGGSVGHLRHFTEFWSVTNNIYKMTLEREQKLIEKFLEPEKIAFDIGANVGVFSCMMSYTYPEASIYSFEPVTSTFEILQSNIKDNKLDNVVCENIALSNQSGSFNFIANEHNPSQNKLSPANQTANNTLSVPTITLDSYCDQKNITELSFVKIDVEGAELLVLEGAKNMLQSKKIAALLIEVIPHAITDMGLNMNKLFDFIENVGYECRQVTDDGNIGSKIDMATAQDFKLENVLLVPQFSN
ncbi:hypothetical protein H1P_140028 [Hyella patelloides LEGE 07179]|uniref:Methyltransferase FkbM domain-containing protein n=1 Tax=Hyella patelloides LEGE 07179 TaxID=945734 RepID=A0A563VLR2_9CYAN|nr:FkbM family methyltransferase [Hyella patelloides]VEP12245.1 hypothetical protein H1P_140028 [Hyella patelloides LEGE 07179]